MKGKIIHRQFYDYPVEKVWHALTDSEAMSQWLMPCNIEPILNHEFQFTTDTTSGFDGTIHCKITEIEDRRILAFSWSAGTMKDTMVVFKLNSVNGGTQLDFTHSGFQGFINRLLARFVLGKGWKSRILKVELPAYLEKIAST